MRGTVTGNAATSARISADASENLFACAVSLSPWIRICTTRLGKPFRSSLVHHDPH
jgi:hypothetical protein